MIKTRIKRLQDIMKQKNIDLYYFNTSDYHMSEYVPEYFKTIAYFSGFSGSLASFIVTGDESYIFVDGRYHTQAEKQCAINGINVVKLGKKDNDDPITFICKNYSDGKLAFDGKRVSVNFVNQLKKHHIRFESIDIYSDLIENRTPLSDSPIYSLDIKYTGLSRLDKINLIKRCLKDKVHIVSSLDTIAYLLNLRGNDILYTPVFLSYLTIIDDDVYLFVDLNKLNEKLLDELYADGIIIRPYDSFYDFIKTIRQRKIIIDQNKVNYQIYESINCHSNIILNRRSIIDDMKAIKNPVEQNNIRLAHIYDAVAMIRFMMWLDSIDKSSVNEYEVSMKLDSIRKEYMANDLSFNSIVGYGTNSAIVHYSCDKNNCASLDNQGVLLVDSGGHYDLGTTDITRTIALGPVDDEVRKYFTLVLKSMFNLSELKFLQGLSGDQIDIIARKNLWKYGIDYRHGTGHGVGYNLSVHEAPPNIRYGETENASQKVALRPGMVFSDEPGVYFEGKFGIRCENLLLCIKDEENEYGQFLRFETLALVPFDLNLIDSKYLDQETIDVINQYHHRVYDTLEEYLNEQEKEYLKRKTMKI